MARAEKRIAIIGSRDYPDWGWVRSQVHRLIGTGYIVISGGARGVDSVAVKYAKEYGIQIEEYPADWNGPQGKGAGFARNQTMAEKCDGCWAFWDGSSKGTLDMIRRVRKLGKPVVVWGPLGFSDRRDPDAPEKPHSQGGLF